MGKIATDATLQELLTLLRSLSNTQQNKLATDIGQLSSLTTNAKGSLVTAINELVSILGALSGLSTSAKNTIVAAINEVLTKTNNASNAIGLLSSLATVAKGNTVAAINELAELYNSQSDSLSLFDNCYAHRCIYRGKRLTLNADFWNAIKDGSFRDIYVGDFLVIRGTYWRIIDINYYWDSFAPWTYPIVHKPHIVVWGEPRESSSPVQNLKGIYKADGDFSGGYYNSDIRNNTLPKFLETLKEIFGAEHMYYHPDYICNAVTSSGVETGWVLDTNSCVELFSWRHLLPSHLAGFHNVYQKVPNTLSNRPYIPRMFKLAEIREGHCFYHVGGYHLLREFEGGTNILVWYGFNTLGTNGGNALDERICMPYFTLYGGE